MGATCSQDCCTRDQVYQYDETENSRSGTSPHGKRNNLGATGLFNSSLELDETVDDDSSEISVHKQKMAVLSKSIGRGLGDDQLSLLARFCEFKTMSANDPVFFQSNVADELLVLRRGCCQFEWMEPVQTGNGSIQHFGERLLNLLDPTEDNEEVDGEPADLPPASPQTMRSQMTLMKQIRAQRMSRSRFTDLEDQSEAATATAATQVDTIKEVSHISRRQRTQDSDDDGSSSDDIDGASRTRRGSRPSRNQPQAHPMPVVLAQIHPGHILGREMLTRLPELVMQSLSSDTPIPQTPSSQMPPTATGSPSGSAMALPGTLDSGSQFDLIASSDDRPGLDRKLSTMNSGGPRSPSNTVNRSLLRWKSLSPFSSPVIDEKLVAQIDVPLPRRPRRLFSAVCTPSNNGQCTFLSLHRVSFILLARHYPFIARHVLHLSGFALRSTPPVMPLAAVTSATNAGGRPQQSPFKSPNPQRPATSDSSPALQPSAAPSNPTVEFSSAQRTSSMPTTATSTLTSSASNATSTTFAQFSLEQALTRVPMFSMLSNDHLQILASLFQIRTLDVGEVLFREGERHTETGGSSMFYLLSGSVHVFGTDDQSHFRLIRQCSPGLNVSLCGYPTSLTRSFGQVLCLASSVCCLICLALLALWVLMQRSFRLQSPRLQPRFVPLRELILSFDLFPKGLRLRCVRQAHQQLVLSQRRQVAPATAALTSSPRSPQAMDLVEPCANCLVAVATQAPPWI